MAEQPVLRQSTAGQQIRQFMAKLSRAQKIIIASVVLASIVGIILIATSTSKPEMGVLFSDLQEKDVALITEKLRERQVPYELGDKGKTVLVPTDILYETRINLASEGLPQTSVVGYELFDKANLGMSDFMQKLNYRRALEGELSRTITTLEEVAKARVHVVVPEKALFEEDQKQPTASVLLQIKPGRRVNKVNIEGIQNLVASSVEGMQPGAVTVIDQRGKILSEPDKDNKSLAGLSSTQYELKQKVDEYYTTRVQSLLDEVIGANNTVVRVNTELDFTQNEKTIEDFDPDRQVVRSEQTLTSQSNSQDSLSYPAVNQQAQSGNTITNYEISKTVQKIVGEVGSLKRISVAAMVNGKTKVAPGADGEPKVEYTPRTAEELEQIRQIVRNAVGYDPARNDQISVVNLEFDTSLLDHELPETGFQWTPQEIAEKVVIVLAMLLAVLMIRKLIASPQVRRRIEQVFAPSELEKHRVELARATAERQQLLLKGLAEETMGVLPEPMNMTELAARKAQFELPEAETSQEALLKQEMKQRVQRYLSEKPEEASRLLKSFLRQTAFNDTTRRK